MTVVPLKFASLSAIEERTGALRHVGGGEGFALYTATFDGQPAVIVDQGTLLDLFPDEGDDDAVLVHAFESEESRDEFVSHLGAGGGGGTAGSPLNGPADPMIINCFRHLNATQLPERPGRPLTS